MLTYSELKQNPRELLAMTSLSEVEFDALLPAFEAAYTAAYPPTLTKGGQPRRRKAGGGAKPRLKTMADKLLFILMYQKVYPLQTALGLQFGYSQPQTNALIQELLPVLQTAGRQAGYAPLREGVLLASEPPQAYQIDGTERRRQRPQDPLQQRDCYSGKKKAHTDKNIVVVNTTTEQVTYLSLTVGGAQHDKKAADAAAVAYPAGSTLTQDLGFQGYAPNGVHVIQPKKQPRGGYLSLYDRLANRMIAKDRITVEHVLARIKRCRIIKDVFRNTTPGMADMVMEIACSLHNLRTEFRQARSPAAIAAKIYYR